MPQRPLGPRATHPDEAGLLRGLLDESLAEECGVLRRAVLRRAVLRGAVLHGAVLRGARGVVSHARSLSTASRCASACGEW
ncbi:pentapeptide repeat-containing protein [Streptomyces jumonjinensis]|uniref:pentapeptide repeat-containing protein n=1 Tax=Streptomyces jumonjinensis TaxID=1945 RepID=UPI00188664DD